MDEEFERHRGVLFGVAYRVLGSVGDAEDVVQETWLRWSAADRTDVRDPRAYLATTAGRLALNTLRAQRNRRETYVGPWLPEPLPLGDADDAAAPVVLEEDVSVAFLVVLESLSPLERVVFVMHDLFGFEHVEVARAVGRSPDAVRQLASRARRHVRERRPRFPAAPREQARVTAEFMRAAVEGDLDGLLALLAPDVVLLTDGGGAAKAARRPISGADKAARFLVAISQDVPGATWAPAGVNGAPGAVVRWQGAVIAAVDMDVVGGRVTTVRAQLNPDKLRRAAEAAGDLGG